MRFVQHYFPHFDAVEILVMAGGALIVVSLALAMWNAFANRPRCSRLFGLLAAPAASWLPSSLFYRAWLAALRR